MESSVFKNLEEIHEFGVQRFEAVTSASASTAKGLQAIAAEAAGYGKRSIDSGYVFAGQLLQAKKPEDLVALHSSFAKAAYEDFLAAVKKMSEVYSALAREAFQDITREPVKTVKSTPSALSPDAQPVAAPKASKQN